MPVPGVILQVTVLTLVFLGILDSLNAARSWLVGRKAEIDAQFRCAGAHLRQWHRWALWEKHVLPPGNFDGPESTAAAENAAEPRSRTYRPVHAGERSLATAYARARLKPFAYPRCQ